MDHDAWSKGRVLRCWGVPLLARKLVPLRVKRHDDASSRYAGLRNVDLRLTCRWILTDKDLHVLETAVLVGNAFNGWLSGGVGKSHTSEILEFDVLDTIGVVK